MNPTPPPTSENESSSLITRAATTTTTTAGQPGGSTSLQDVVVGVTSGGAIDSATTTLANNNSTCNPLPTIRNFAAVSSAAAVASTTATGQTTPKASPAASADGKRLIRTIRPIDLSKLQQTGLDRKIAEVLSKQKQINHVKRLANEVKHLTKASSSNTPQKLYKVLKPVATLATATSSASVTAAVPSTSATTSYQTTFKEFTKLAAASTSAPSSPTVNAAKSFTTRPIIPPKITITGPDVYNEGGGENALSVLSPEQRMQHVKDLLHKKILQKQKQISPVSKDGKKLHIHLKPPSSPSRSPHEPLKSPANLQINRKLPTIADKPKHLTPSLDDKTVRNLATVAKHKLPTNSRTSKANASPKQQDVLPGTFYCKSAGKTYVIHKDVSPAANKTLAAPKMSPTSPVDVRHTPSEHLHKTPSHKLPTKPVTPKKSPQDIARKLDFQGEEQIIGVVHSPGPTVSNITTATATNVTPVFVHGALSNKVTTSFASLPKSLINAANTTPPSNRHVTIAKQRIVIPDVSPLKTPFPTANVPLETPLPTIDTFKKPYPLIPDTSYFTLLPQTPQHLVYTNVPSSCYQTAQYSMSTAAANLQMHPSVAVHSGYNFPTTSGVVTGTSNLNVAPNSLIVLENKVLSQDEMIDLTALRLSKFESPQRFARPHKPIPEVVIKQEKPDDFPPPAPSHIGNDSAAATSNDATSSESNIVADCFKPTDSRQLEEPQKLIMISAKQNKKYVVNAQKLKLPPEKIADLAKKIAEQTARENQLNQGLTITAPIRPLAFKPIAQCPISRQNTNNDNIAFPENTNEREGGTLTTYTGVNSYITTQADIKDCFVPNRPFAHNTFKYGSANSAFKQIGQQFGIKEEVNTPPTPVAEPNYCNITSSSKKQQYKQSVEKEVSRINFPLTFKTSASKNRKPAVEILEEPATEDSFSAVDFLANFACGNEIAESTQLDLTPDELNLNASFGMNYSPLRAPSFSPRKRKVSSSSTAQQDRKGADLSQFDENNLKVGSKKPNENVSSSVPMFAPGSSLAHDILFNKATGFTAIPKASIRQTTPITPLIIKRNISPLNSDAVTPSSVDTIIIESSRGRDHVLRKSLDHKSPKKSVKTLQELKYPMDIEKTMEAVAPNKENEYSSKLSGDGGKPVQKAETTSSSLFEEASLKPLARSKTPYDSLNAKEIANKDLQDTAVRFTGSADYANIDIGHTPQIITEIKEGPQSMQTAHDLQTKDMTEKDSTDLMQATNDVQPKDMAEKDSTFLEFGQGNKATSEPPSTNNLTNNMQDYAENINLFSDTAATEDSVLRQTCLAGTAAVSNETDNQENIKNKIQEQKLTKTASTELSFVKATNEGMSSINKIEPSIEETAAQNVAKENNDSDTAHVTEIPSVPLEPQVKAKSIGLDATADTGSNLKSILKSTITAEDNNKTAGESTLNTTGTTQSAAVPPPPPSKRISRFKKGKINLVQRSKPSSATAAKQTESLPPKTNEPKAIVEGNIAQKETVSISSNEPERISSSKALSQSSDVKTSHLNDKDKDTERVEIAVDNRDLNNKINESVATANLKQDANFTVSLGNDKLQDDHSIKKQKNALLQFPSNIVEKITVPVNESNDNSASIAANDLEGLPKETSLDANNTREAEISDKLCNNLENSALTKVDETITSVEEQMNTTSVNTKTSQEISVAAANLTTSDEQEKSNNNEEILKVLTPIITAATKDNCYSLLPQQQREEPTEPLKESETFNASVTNIDLPEYQQMDNEESDITVAETPIAKISSLVKQPKMPKRGPNVVNPNEIHKESDKDNSKPHVAVSLTNIVNCPLPETVQLTPPQIPFKRKCLETSPMATEVTKGIKNLLSKIKRTDEKAEQFSKGSNERPLSKKKKSHEKVEEAGKISNERLLSTTKKTYEETEEVEKGSNDSLLSTTKKTNEESEKTTNKSNDHHHEKYTQIRSLSPNQKDNLSGGEQLSESEANTKKAESKITRSCHSELESDSNIENNQNDNSVLSESKGNSPIKTRKSTKKEGVDETQKECKDPITDAAKGKLNKRQKANVDLKATEQKDLKVSKRRKRLLLASNDEVDEAAEKNLEVITSMDTENLAVVEETHSTTDCNDYGKTAIDDLRLTSQPSDDPMKQMTENARKITLHSKPATTLISSCQDLKTLHPRKKLRKIVDHSKKSQKPAATDSEDDHDFDSANGFCEAADDFLGFEDNSVGSSKSRKPCEEQQSSDDEKNPNVTTKTKGGTLKNWLTTGKAISPTFAKDEPPKRLRHDNANKFAVTRGGDGMPLKKRWDLSAKFQEDTDVTDDTSPADDEEEEEEEESEIKAPCKNTKKRLKSVIVSNKVSRAKKKCVNDNDGTASHIFVEPTPLEPRTRISETDSDAPVFTSVRRLKRRRRLLSDDFEGSDNKTEELEASNVSAKLKQPELVSPAESLHSDETMATEKTPIGKKVRKRIAKPPMSPIENMKNISPSIETLCPSKSSDENTKGRKREYTQAKADEDQNTPIEQTPKVIKSKGRSKRSNAKELLKQDNTIEGEIPRKAEESNARFVEGDIGGTPVTSSIDDATKNIPQDCEEPKTPKVKPATEAVTTAKRRGRPRKSQTIVLTHEPDVETPKSIPSEEVNPNKRPKIEDVTDVNLTSPTATNVKRRGRSKTGTPSNINSNAPLLLIKNPEQINTDKTLEEVKQVTASIMSNVTTPNISPCSKDTAKPPVDAGTETTPIVRRRGRQSLGSSQAPRFNPRLLLATKREQVDTDESLVEAKQGTGSIQCGLCMGKTTQSKWHLHLATHYGVGWKQGEEKLNTENRATVLNSIISFLRDTEIKILNCRMCDKSYRSGLGMLAHIESCGAEVQRPLCGYCHKDYAILSLPIHVRSCPERLKLLYTPEEIPVQTIPAEPVFSTTGRTKRVSTLKAESRLKTLGAELVKPTEEDDFNPKLHVKYNAPVGDDVRDKWTKAIAKIGHATCPSISCQFSSNLIDTLDQHITECTYVKKPGYYCEFCKDLCFAQKTKAVEHVIKFHSPGNDFSGDSDCNIQTDDDQSSNDDEDLSEEELDEDELEALESSKNKSSKATTKEKSPNSKQTSSANTSQIILRKKVFSKRTLNISEVVRRKWKNFLKLNYASNILFENSKSLYTILKTQQYTKYLPPQHISMKFSFQSKAKLNTDVGVPDNDIEWSQIERFSTFDIQNESFLFVGAPVTCCSWLPLPADVEEQYLLVAYRKDMFKFCKFSNPKHCKTTLLLFKVTKSDSKTTIPQISLHYGVTIDDGPVHKFDFLPSGGYNEKDNRLGLVAVASVLPTIKVYALPIDISKACDARDNVPLITVTPSFELRLDILQRHTTEHVLVNPQCLQIIWSEFLGHNHIFAGFSNGFIGIWDITDDPQDNLNRLEVDNLKIYVPLNYFYIGEKGIRTIAVHYDTTGPRWLAVAGYFRRLVVYDIRNMTEPIAVREEGCRNIIRCIDWCPLWEPFLIGYCDSIPNNGRCIQCIIPTNVMYTQQKLDLVVSAVTGIHYNPYYNMCVACVDNGDVLFMDTREIHYEHALDKKFGERRILACMDVKKLDGKPIPKLVGAKSSKGRKGSSNINGQHLQKLETEWIMYDADYKEKYGLVFQPPLKLRESLKTPYFNEKRRAPLNIVPYMRMNTLRCNLNDRGKRLIAMGYENGFLRVIYFDKNYHFCRW